MAAHCVDGGTMRWLGAQRQAAATWGMSASGGSGGQQGGLQGGQQGEQPEAWLALETEVFGPSMAGLR